MVRKSPNINNTIVPTSSEPDWITPTLKARSQKLSIFKDYLSCEAKHALDLMVMVIKGQCGAAEKTGAKPFSGFDGTALNSAFDKLGWGEDGWYGLLLAPSGACALEKEQLRILIEALDPTVIVTVDEPARQLVAKTVLDYEQLAAWASGTTTDAQGRLLVRVDGFEAALGSETEKQMVWQQLKGASRSEVLRRFR